MGPCPDPGGREVPQLKEGSETYSTLKLVNVMLAQCAKVPPICLVPPGPNFLDPPLLKWLCFFSESFTADHKPLLGEDPNMRGFYHGCGFNSSGMMLSKLKSLSISIKFFLSKAY